MTAIPVRPDMAAIEHALRLSMTLADNVELGHDTDGEFLSTVRNAISKALVRDWFEGAYDQAVDAVLDLHAGRQRTVDGYTLRWCRECGQDYPCPTVQAAHSGSEVMS